ncbi:CopD family protein [Hyphococcus sp.]|uniref:CopD family protein n=1 Tax=Hyphococcus sp. TaxID=2038636 RepID=UPI0020882032|nr:MAG: hypothetical protein DHS20C04_30270 [Marinicaulis sp.]
MPDTLSLLAFAVQFGYYAVALLLVGILLGRGFGVTRKQSIPASALLALVVLSLYAVRLMLANAKLGGSFIAAFDLATLPWIWRAYELQAFAVMIGCGLAAAGALLQWWLAMLAAALMLSASFGLAGHTQGLEAPGIFPWLAGLHVLVAGFWFAAPVSLWPRTKLDQAELVRRLETFSHIAQFAVPALFGAGLILALRLADGWGGLIGSAYGRLLLAKLFVASAALALGAFNKTWVTGRMAQNEHQGRAALKLTLSIEFVAFLSTLALIALATTALGPEDL